MEKLVPMDAHTLELLEFAKVLELVAGYASCSLGKDLARLGAAEHPGRQHSRGAGARQ